ncbi:MAG: hypothetical protein HY452_01405 [Parcubacteria group bacterium]|nr:hypothetical protein [Parcubacteria group bacterium]
MPDNLEELQKKLYTPEKPALPKVDPEAAPPEPPLVLPPPPPDALPSSRIWNKIFLGAGIFLFLAATVAVYIFFRGFYAFRKDRVEIKLFGPAEIAAGQTAVWKLGLVNKNETELKDAELIFQFPDFSKPTIAPGESGQFKLNTLKQTIAIPEIKAGGLFEREFSAALYGGENFERKAQAVFKFKPSAGNIIFESVATASTKITSFPVGVAVEAAPETVSGEKVEIAFNLKNDSENSFQNLRARLEYPSGFRLEKTSEKIFEFDNVWRLDEILPQESKTLTVTGTVTGLEGENKVFRVFVEGLEGSSWKTYKESSGQMKLIMPPLALYLNTEPDGLALARSGEAVTYKFVWQNNLDIPISNLTLKVVFDGADFDFLSQEFSSGFNAVSKTLVLNKDNYSKFFGLQPLERGELAVKIRIKNTSPLSGAKLTAAAALESTTQPEGLSVSKISAGQSLTLEIK